MAKAHNQWAYFFANLNKVDAKQRDETLAELASAYFIENFTGASLNIWWPIGRNGTPADYEFTIFGLSVFCEVKSPGWEAAIVREEGKSASRLKLPKYLNAEFRPVDNSFDLRCCLEKAYPNLPQDRPTMIMVVDDLFFPLRYDDLAIDRVLHDPARNGCFTSKEFERLGGVGFFNVMCQGGNIQYYFNLFVNDNALPAVQLPDNFISRWQGSCMFCHKDEK